MNVEAAHAQPFRVEIVAYDTAREQLHAVREEVFIGEQHVPAELERDALDPLSTHALATLLDGTPVGAARLTPDRHVGRMAVRQPWRGHGIGDALLTALVNEARRLQWPDLALNAQVDAIDFYLRHGFQPRGERLMEAGIEHQAMARTLAGATRIERQAAAIEATCEIVNDARRHLWIRSFVLDPGLLDQAGVMDALRRFATSGRGNEVRILLHDAAAVQRSQAPLLALAQRLPSIFLFRELDDPVDRNDPACWIAGDGGSYYLRKLGQRIEGEAERNAPARVRQLRAGFDEAWERSRPVAEFRALGL